MRGFLLAALLALFSTTAHAQVPPTGSGTNGWLNAIYNALGDPSNANAAAARVPLTASATGTTGSVAATLAAAAGKTTYICGFTITFSNPTAAANVTSTVAGTITGTMSYQRQVLAAGAAVQAPQDLNVTYTPCVPGSAVNTAIVVTQPGLGAGATGTSVVAHGYQR